MNGWLLDLYEDPADGVRLWFICDDGERRMFRQPFPVTFYASGSQKALHDCCLFLKDRADVCLLARETKRDIFLPEPICVLRIDTPNPCAQRTLFSILKRRFPDLIWYNADTAIQTRHAAFWGTFPMAYCGFSADEHDTLTELTVRNSRWDLQPLLPVLNILEIKADCDPSVSEPRALVLTAKGRRQRISLSDPEESVSRINEIIDRIDPDIIQTVHGDDHLIPMLLEMEKESGLPLHLNRDEERSITWNQAKSYFSYGQIIYRAEEAHFYGRCHIDTQNAMMWRDYKIDGTLETARVTALPIEQASRVSPGSGISSMQIITALQHDVLVPEQKQQSEMEKSAIELIQADRGGMIYQPRTGLYSNIAEVDFVSMYPAIIINRNISPEIREEPDEPPAEEDLGIIPLTLKPLYEKRVAIKQRILSFPDKSDPIAKSLSARASALKWLLVVCFGFLGYKNARFGRIESHEAVTRGGRETLLLAKETAEEMGFEVLHMFVDALWLRKKGCSSVADFQPVLDEISHRTHMMIALDGIYTWVAFLPSRSNENLPVPNRYFGAFRDGSLKLRGIEARRHDSPPWIIETQKKALECLAKADDARELPDYLRKAFKILKDSLEDFNADRVPMESLVLTMRVSRELDAYKSPPPAVRAAKQLLEQTGQQTAPGQKVRFIFVSTPDKVRAWELPGEADPQMIDKAKYRELFGRAAGTILYPFGIDPKEIENWAQGGLQLRLC